MFPSAPEVNVLEEPTSMAVKALAGCKPPNKRAMARPATLALPPNAFPGTPPGLRAGSPAAPGGWFPAASLVLAAFISLTGGMVPSDPSRSTVSAMRSISSSTSVLSTSCIICICSSSSLATEGCSFESISLRNA